MMKKAFHGFVICLLMALPAFSQVVLREGFKPENTPPAPDYSRPEHWASLPSKKDPADSLPRHNPQLSDSQSVANADVFFLHPTIFTEAPKNQYLWNADVNDVEMNKKVDYSTILNQASVFNGSCRIYAPRYRQAHLFAFYTNDKDAATQAFDIAYADIKAAFEYYLANYNHDRPIVIAAHSQGTVHAKRLLNEFFDGKPLQNRLIVAYLIGMPTLPDAFKNIPPGTAASQTGCFVNWRTFQRNYTPDGYFQKGEDKSLSVNPLSWDTTSVLAGREKHRGAVGLKFTMTKPHLLDAENHLGMLWIGKLHIPGALFVNKKNWHAADYNLFWMNIRENVALRVNAFLKSSQK